MPDKDRARQRPCPTKTVPDKTADKERADKERAGKDRAGKDRAEKDRKDRKDRDQAKCHHRRRRAVTKLVTPEPGARERVFRLPSYLEKG